MSSAVVRTIQVQLKIIGYPLLLILGIAGNAFSVLVFRKQRQSPCAIYLSAFAATNIIYIIFNSAVQLFPTSFNDGSVRASIVCKIHSYVPVVIGQINSTMLVLACLDRFLITSHRATFRAFSTVKRAKRLIAFFVIFWSLTTIHSLITASVVGGQCPILFYSVVPTVYAVVFIGFLPPGLLGVFSYLTYRNIKRTHHRVQPIGHHANEANPSIPRRDRSLLILVISELLVYIVTSSPFPLIVLEMLITQYTMPTKAGWQIEIEYFMLAISLFLLSVNSALPFYIYLIVSKTFRADVKQIIMNVYQKLGGRRPTRIIAATDPTIKRRDTRV